MPNNQINEKIENVKKARKKSTKKSVKKSTKRTSKKNTKRTKSARKSTKRKNVRRSTSLVPRRSAVSMEPETVSEELRKISNIKSMEQQKKPRRIAFMIGFYVLLFIAVIVFCMIWFSKSDKRDESTNEYDFEYVEYSSVDIYDNLFPELNEEETTEEETFEDTTIDEVTNAETVTAKKENTKKETSKNKTTKTESTKKSNEKEETIAESSYKTSTEILKAVRESTTKKSNISIGKREITNAEIGAASNNKKIIEKLTNTRDKDAVYDFAKEIYSKATYYQFSANDIMDIKNMITDMYDSIKDDVFGDAVSFDLKGKNGIIYINYQNLMSFIKEKTDTRASEYDALIPVERLSDDIIFNFTDAADRGIYYDIPANNGTRMITMKILKGAKVGFTSDYALTSTLEILDMECNTKINTYYGIEDLVGKNPRYLNMKTDGNFDIGEALKNKRFNYVIYDKKGYITDLICFIKP